MTVQLTDTHCHLDFDAYETDLLEVIQRARDAGVIRILTIGIDLETSENAIRLAEKYPDVYAAVGVHPNTEIEWNDRVASRVERLLPHEKVVAIGEIGLDYYRDYTTPEEQKARFRQQLDLASRAQLPVVIHTRNTSASDRGCILDTLETLRNWNAGRDYTRDDANPIGVLHSFSGNGSEAAQAIDMGFLIGITGPVTFKNARDLQFTVAGLPLDRLLIETDGPFLAPHPHRGKRNEPVYVKLVAEKIAELKDLPLHEISERTTNNAQRLFKWSYPIV